MNTFINWRRTRSRRAVLLKSGSILLWLSFATGVMAQSDDPKRLEPLKRLSLAQLAQTEITSVNKEAVPAFQTPAAISVMTHEEILRSGARNIPDLLRLTPGVEVGQIDSNEWAVGVRGFEGKLSRAMLTYRYVSAIPNQLVRGYSTADFRLGRPLGRHFEVELVGRNLLQPSHAEYGGNPGPLVGIRRSGFVALTWTP